MELTRVQAQWFKSFGEIDVSLSPGTLYLVQGLNRDDGGSDSNGSGKTSFFELVTWVLFGQLPGRTLSVDDVIHSGKEECSGSLEFSNGLKVHRTRSLKGSGELLLTLPGTSTPLDLGTATSTQAKLFEVLNYDQDSRKDALTDFVSSVYLFIGRSGMAGGTLVNTTSVKERMEVISRYLRLSQIERAHALAQQYVKGFDDRCNVLEAKIDAYGQVLTKYTSLSDLRKKLAELDGDIAAAEEDHSRYEASLGELRSRLGVSQQLESLRKDLSRLKEERKRELSRHQKEVERLRVSQEACHSKKEELEKLQSQVLQLKPKKTRERLDEVQSQLDGLERKERLAQDVVDRHVQSRDELLLRLKSPQECPHCQEEIFVQEDRSVVRFARTLVEKQLSRVEDDIVKAQEFMERVTVSLAKASDLRNGLEVTWGNIERVQKLIQSCQQSVEFHARVVGELCASINNDRVAFRLQWKSTYRKVYQKYKSLKKEHGSVGSFDSLTGQIRLLEDQCGKKVLELAHLKAQLQAALDDRRRSQAVARSQKILRAKVHKIRRRSEHYATWIQGFANIRRSLVFEFLPAFEFETNEMLQSLGTGMRIRIELTLPKKSQEGLKEAFDIQVFRAKSWQSLSSLSKGEAARVGVMLSIALKKMARNNSHSQFSWLMCDEVADSLDESGLQLFFEALARLPYQTFVVSHRDISAAGALRVTGAKILQITKRRGISSAEIRDAA